VAVQMLISWRKAPAKAGPRARRAGGSQRVTETWPSTHQKAQNRAQGLRKSSKRRPQWSPGESPGGPQSKRGTETWPSTDPNANTRPQGAQSRDQSLPNGTHEKAKGCPRAADAAKGGHQGDQKTPKMRGCRIPPKP